MFWFHLQLKILKVIKKLRSIFPANPHACATLFFLLNIYGCWQISDTSWKEVTDFVLEVILCSILSADNWLPS